MVAAALVGGALFAGHFGLQGVITAGRATLEADAAASGLPVTVAVTGKAAAHLADDAAGLVDDAVGLADDAVGATDDALRAAKGGIGAESLAGKCDASARALLEKIPGSRLQQAPPGKPGHFAVRKPDGTIVDETLRDNLMTYGAKVDDVPIEKTEFTEKEWFDLVDRFPNMADEIVAHFKDPFG